MYRYIIQITTSAVTEENHLHRNTYEDSSHLRPRWLHNEHRLNPRLSLLAFNNLSGSMEHTQDPTMDIYICTTATYELPNGASTVVLFILTSYY